MSKVADIILILIGLTLVGLFIGASILLYSEASLSKATANTNTDLPNKPAMRYLPTHIKTPDAVKAIYMTAWTASAPIYREKIWNTINNTDINAIVIDIKDDSGHISINLSDPVIKEYGAVKPKIHDIEELIKTLHEKNIYIIGRVQVFQDPYLAIKNPDWAVKTKNGQAVWKDRKGISWLDANNENVWDYVSRIAEGAYNLGFDEINFDYVRFPSDGNMQDISFPASEGLVRKDVMKKFYSYLDTRLRPQGIVISADLFGMTTNNSDDLGIGQILTDALPHFDYIAPMIYPSHYPQNFHGYTNPAANPYEIITIAMKGGIEKAESIGEPKEKLRPWIQDFNLGAKYTSEMVRAQLTALYDLDIYSFMSWDPSNTYTNTAYVDLKEKEEN